MSFNQHAFTSDETSVVFSEMLRLDAHNHVGGTRTPAILAGGYLPTRCQGRQSYIFMHVADWMATLASVAGVPAAVLAHANASGPKPLDSFNMAPLLFGDAGQCGANRLASPRTSLMYFYGDDTNGACKSKTRTLPGCYALAVV